MRQDSSMDVLRAATTIGRVWRHVFLDAFLAPRRFRRLMPELRSICDAEYHPGIADVAVFDLPGKGPIQILDLDGSRGGMYSDDLYALLRVVRWLKPRRIFEIGTYNGFTTAHLAINSEAEVYTLDLPLELAGDLAGYTVDEKNLVHRKDQIGSFYRGLDVRERIHQLFGDSRTFNFAPYCGSADLVLIDACHLYDWVISDSDRAFQLLGESGVILWHDFASIADVTRACMHLAKKTLIFHLQATWLALHARGISIPGSRPVASGNVPASHETVLG